MTDHTEEEPTPTGIALMKQLAANMRAQGDGIIAKIYEAKAIGMEARYQAKIIAEATANAMADAMNKIDPKK